MIPWTDGCPFINPNDSDHDDNPDRFTAMVQIEIDGEFVSVDSDIATAELKNYDPTLEIDDANYAPERECNMVGSEDKESQGNGHRSPYQSLARHDDSLFKTNKQCRKRLIRDIDALAAETSYTINKKHLRLDWDDAAARSTMPSTKE